MASVSDKEKSIHGVYDNTLDDGLNIYEYKTFCKKLAYLIGYHENSINEAFGENDE
jgi:hypothetical protein